MKKSLLAFSFLSIFLFSCNNNTTPILMDNSLINSQNQVQANVNTNFIYSFSAYLNINEPNYLDKYGKAEMLMKVKGLIKRFDNIKRVRRYSYQNFIDTPELKWNVFPAKIRLGKDKILYVENNYLGNHDYIRIGTYSVKEFKQGESIKYKLDKNIKLRMDKINSFDEIYIDNKNPYEPLKKEQSEFL